jgi:hypothetical protein
MMEDKARLQRIGGSRRPRRLYYQLKESHYE